ncbi:hypothetical protein M011DRAFT_489579 [Sporormia fimetaria CBS 119925]|uniref:SWR1-complex protein 3 domain-containing protein n=1 Tax=Sporormia fimetaria CBS 119925 TaxID=1340428 RepID=A0A6A6V0U5_9PLEO|nr:hypothetical protein M011DRAFT_489579 [Sporormia fimetaria CBS 119925]
MSELRRSTRARAREEAEAPPPEPVETPSKPATKAPRSKRKRPPATPRDATPAGSVSGAGQQIPGPLLPYRLLDGQPLPTLNEPQPLDLPSSEYQDVRQSGVLSASLQRSRAVWISGSNFRLFHAFFTPPKKVADRTPADKAAIQRQKDIVRNFPQLGGGVEAQLVIEPHTFPIRLYGPREFVRQAQKKPAPQYGQWPNHTQYPPYQQQPQQQYHDATPHSNPPPPQPRPPPPKPQPKPAPPRAPTTQTAAPDPVIHMLAQRAGTNPELKAVMKIVAAGQANADQLAFFQRHIQELTNILEKQKAEAAARPPSEPAPTPAPAPSSQAAPYQSPQQPPAVSHPPPNPPKPQPAPSAYKQSPQQQTPKSYPPATNQPTHHHHQAPPSQPRPPPHPNQYTYNQNYNQQQQHIAPMTSVAQPQRTSYRPLVFDFVEGNGDKFYLPSYSFMEWLPNNRGIKFSFLITKMKPKPEVAPAPMPSTPAPAPNSTLANAPPVQGTPHPPTASTPNATATKTTPHPQPAIQTPANPQQQSATPSTPTPNTHPTQGPTPHSNPTPLAGPTSQQPTPQQQATPQQPTPQTPQYTPPPRIEDFDEKHDIDNILFYRPLTLVLETSNPEILSSLPRAFRPLEVVQRYMDEVFDRCQRDGETFLAFRLPKEEVGAGGGGESVAGDMRPPVDKKVKLGGGAGQGWRRGSLVV